MTSSSNATEIYEVVVFDARAAEPVSVNEEVRALLCSTSPTWMARSVTSSPISRSFCPEF